MKEVHLRFYEELNDYLPSERKKHTFSWHCRGGETIADLLESVGVPLAVVDLILVDGNSVAPAHVIHDQDRIAVYPVFESMDIGAITRVREEPLRRPRFIADPGLEPLAACLCRRGLDARCGTGCSAAEVDALAEKEARILLTLDKSHERRTARVCRVRRCLPDQQAADVIERLDLFRHIRNSTVPNPDMPGTKQGCDIRESLRLNQC